MLKVRAHWKRLETEYIILCINKTKIMVLISINKFSYVDWLEVKRARTHTHIDIQRICELV